MLLAGFHLGNSYCRPLVQTNPAKARTSSPPLAPPVPRPSMLRLRRRPTLWSGLAPSTWKSLSLQTCRCSSSVVADPTYHFHHVVKLQYTCTKTPTSKIQKCQLARLANIHMDDKVLNDESFLCHHGAYGLLHHLRHSATSRRGRRCVS
jgi:hypothetical protein